ncbi:nitric oxide reductase transcription regulator [Vibrio breoganii]|uniref:nitric oxide reductase transcriptional regulator NorR n=1 Tax=Vibrio breoganii TaxID=553239 RepID=UPI000C85D543|nr:nitric oxide reductase transcriptional regulator NorR [Vibrio breoganii]PMG36298.1 nitric oxide reductase transcription regulator [Vibrio breoganii]PMG92391.1 nitric oxide reductase transcription regulator [Vibrio breoganii]PMK16417.1 nitric oxide reductase transcription regulator [Vibrio breoganii]PMO64039.1 nitric oxide reductase transcription regulator [Vibrio breoganii]
MKKYKGEWIQVARDITSGISEQDRFQRLLTTIRNMLHCDAAALLLFQHQNFIPLAINGLSEDVLGRRFNIEQHPRLEAIARAGDIVRFPSDSDLPDPYDALIPNHEQKLEVHSCIGLPLFQEDRLIGAVTIDAFDPTLFDGFADDDFRLISALAANSLHTALLVAKLEKNVGVSSTSNNKRTNYNQLDFIGQSQGITELKSHISAVAHTELSVLIMGETGVGKELVAHAIYSQSDRKDKAFVYLNCAALPESVAESELFGHIKGAFTGAISDRKGKFELANHGTLFLDEVGELSLALQAKLLRALQYGDIQRVGDDSNIKVDVRIIAATNRVMHEEVKKGHFRSDLYHRLSVFPLFVPPLRERDKDVILLAGFFAQQCQHKLNVSSITLDAEVLTLLQNNPWEGNVRELEHTINRASVIAKAQSNAPHLVLKPSHFQFAHSDMPNTNKAPSLESPSTQQSIEQWQDLDLKEATEQFQIQLIQSAFLNNDKKLSATAKQLGLNPGNLHRLMKRLGLK